jgi:hypothetical protein
MKTANLIPYLNQLDVSCPGCESRLFAEKDKRHRTGLAWACANPECSEANGCWPVIEHEISVAMFRSELKSCAL